MDDVATNGNANAGGASQPVLHNFSQVPHNLNYESDFVQNIDNDVNQAEAESEMVALVAPVVSTDEWCEICRVNCKTKSELAIHIGGAKHQKRLVGYELLQKLMQQEDCFIQDPVSGSLKCLVCSTEMSAPHHMEAHLAGEKHKKKRRVVKNAGAEDAVKKEKPATVEYWCELCKISGGSPNIMGIEKHMQGAKHLKKVARNELLEKLKENTRCFEHDEESGIFKCKVCLITSNNPKFLEDHFEGSKHKLKVDKLEGRVAKRKHDGDSNYTKHCPADAERTIFFKNITFTSAETEIRTLFQDCGEIETLNIIKVFGPKDKGFGFLMFKEKQSVMNALKKNQTCLEGKPVHVAAYVPEERYKLKRSEELEKNKLLSGHPTTMSVEENQMEHTSFNDLDANK